MFQYELIQNVYWDKHQTLTTYKTFVPYIIHFE